MKLASIFFTASAVYFRGLSQRYKLASEKYEACFNIFLQRAQYIFEVYLKDSYTFIKNKSAAPNLTGWPTALLLFQGYIQRNNKAQTRITSPFFQYKLYNPL